jgi:ribosomal protein S18 acetylase RimI-like enzyme
MESMNSKNRTYLIREFSPSSDLDDAYECYVSSFNHINWPIVNEAAPQLIKDTILFLHHIGSKTLVAEADGRARGVLVGLLRPRLATAGRALAVSARILCRWTAGRYRLSWLAKKHLFQLFRGSFPYIYLHPSSEAETLLLMSHKEYRGGIGRALMDAWVAEVRSSDSRNASVGTDSTLSWDFYERYGYHRMREFDYTAYKYSLPKKEVKGYIYLLDIK